MAAPRHTAEDDVQAEVVAFLGDASTYGVGEVRRYETHAARVFLAGDRVFKIKRPVRYPFLDFSTLGKRKAACQAELEVNRNFAPQLYRRVVPITREADGRLAIGGVGAAVEWAVEMKRFDDDSTLDRLAERGALTDDLAAKLAVMVAAMHGRAKPADADSWIASLNDFVTDNSAVFQRRAELFPAPDATELDRRSKAALARLKPLLRERGALGLIRRGHGDLHLGNIALIDNEPVAFDALEFDPVIAAGDVLYDLAFLLMDMLERGVRGGANIVLNGYFSATRRAEDYDGIAALPLFMSVRAAIRAKVTAARLDLAADKATDDIARSARRYFDLALDLLAPVEPAIVGTGGLSGTGKSRLARQLAPLLSPAPGALVLRSDVERKALYGVPQNERLPAEAYRAELSETIYRILNENAARIARASHSVIVDAVFAKAEERAALEAVAAATHVRFNGLFLHAELATRIGRIGNRGPDASDADAAVAKKQEDFAVGEMNWSFVDASGSPENTLQNACMALKIPVEEKPAN